MGFGKRGAGDAPPARPSVQPQSLSESDGVHSVRTRVANDGGLDRGFIGLAVNRHNPPNSVLRCNGCSSPQVAVTAGDKAG